MGTANEKRENRLQLLAMVHAVRAQSGQLGFEELAWSLFESTAADQMFVYRANETDGTLDPALALGALSLTEKQSFWASQLDPAGDPLAVQLLAQPGELAISEDQVLHGEYAGSILAKLRSLAWLVYPLTNREGILGAAMVGWFTSGADLPEPLRKQARIIAHAMALETDTARMYELTHQQRQQAQIAQETTQAILRRDSLPNTLRLVAGEVMLAADALGCAIRLLDDQGREVLGVQVGEPAASPVSTGDTLPDRQAPFVLSLQTEPFDKVESGVLLVAPLVNGQRTVGFLELTQIAVYHQPKDLISVRAFADQAAVAVELDRLYARLQQTAVAEERARLARDLHDSISQSIYAMTLYTRAARRKLEDGNVTAVDKFLSDLHTTAREVLGEMRLLIYELRPMALERYGLKGILEQRLQSVEARSGLEVSLDIQLTNPLPPLVEENLYHIALEALNNTIKHAQANRVWVSIQQEDGDGNGHALVRLAVRDDGAGFDPAEVAQGGVGLKSIRERVEMLHGRLSMDARPGAGVNLLIEVPYGEN